MVEIRAGKNKSPRPTPALKALTGTAVALLAILVLLLLIEGVLQIVGLLYSPEGSWEPRKDGTIPILCVGDSHTYGLDVLEPFKYPNRLNLLLNGGREKDLYQVVSRGVPGRNTPVMREKLPLYIDQVRPKVVLILGGYNNSWNSDGSRIWEGGSTVDSFLSKFKVYKFVKLTLRNLKGTSSQDGFRIASDGGEGFRVIEDGEERAINQGEGSAPGLRTGQELERVTREDLVACVSICREGGAEPVLLTYAMTGGDFDAVNGAARAAARDTGALLIDLAEYFTPLIEKEGWDRLFFKHLHLRELGYQLAAEAIAEFLAKEGLVEKQPGTCALRAEPKPEDMHLSLEVEYQRENREPLIWIDGAKGVTFLLVLCEREFPGGADLVKNAAGFAALQGSRLVELSRATPSFTGTLKGEAMRLKVPSYFKQGFEDREIFGCLLALNRYAPEGAPLLLAATETVPISIPRR